MKTLSRRDLLKTSLLAPAAVAAQGMGPMGAVIEAAAEETHPQPANSAQKTVSVRRGARTAPARLRLALPPRQCERSGQGLRLRKRPDRQLSEDRKLSSCRQHRLRRQRLARRRSAPRLGRRAALRERSRARQQRLLPAGPKLSGDQRGLVSPRLRASRRRRGQAHHHRVRRLVPRDHGGLQRLLHRPAQRRIRSVQFRRDRLRESRRKQRSAGARGCHIERRLVLRGRGHLPARLAGEDAPGAREAVGHVCLRRSQGAATLLCRFAPRWRTSGKTAQNARVISTVLDPAGKEVGKAVTPLRVRSRRESKPTSRRLA